MEVSEVQKLAAELREEIRRRVEEFEKATGCEVVNLSASRTNIYSPQVNKMRSLLAVIDLDVYL